MTELVIDGLHAGVDGTPILQGVDLVVRSGEVHAVMGPNGSGKSTLSHVIMGRPGYEVTAGSITLDGVDILALDTWERAQAGLFLALQYPTEVPGVSVEAMLAASFAAGGRDVGGIGERLVAEAGRIGFAERLSGRDLNVDLSGGEKKRNETLQLGVLEPKIAILDELDSGLDVDALRDCSRRVEQATTETGLGVLAITHYTRLLRELKVDSVHILVKGSIRAVGGPELADELETDGYAAYVDDEPAPEPPKPDPFGPGPFADPLG
jgi:Fe-S cluster assembly ATP-binding protein